MLELCGHRGEARGVVRPIQSTLSYQELPLEQRVAVILCDVQGLSYEEIATTTQVTLGTVRSRIARGRARLRGYLYKHQELLPRGYRLYTDRE